MKRESNLFSKNVGRNGSFSFWYGCISSIPKRDLILSMLYGALRILFSGFWPFLLYRLLKELSITTNHDIAIYVSLVVLVLIIAAAMAHFQSIININILRNFTLNLIDSIWNKMNSLDYLTFHRHSRVFYFDLLMTEVWRIRTGLLAILESLIINSAIAGILSLAIVYVSLPLFLLCFGGFFVMGVCYYISLFYTRSHIRGFHRAWSNQHQWISKSVDQFDLVKMGRGFKESSHAHLNQSASFLNVNRMLLSEQSKWRNINQLITNIVRIVVFVVGIYWVRVGVVKLEDLFLVLLIVTLVQGYIILIPSALNSLLEAQESLVTIKSFFSLKDENTMMSHQIEEITPVSAITIHGLKFSYNDKTVLDNQEINLQVGKIYLWRGRNGSGKSTAAHIVLGLIEPQEGTLCINGETQNWDVLRAMRHRFGFLNQDSPIFMGTVKENALFGNPHPEKAWEFLNSSWLMRLFPKNIVEDRVLGERGEGLSGGEGKRVALIRELLRSSDILIMDEPLNHLDELAIEEIKNEIVKIKAKTIIIIISHQTGFESIADEIKEF